jgi:hypothetical protein
LRPQTLAGTGDFISTDVLAKRNVTDGPVAADAPTVATGKTGAAMARTAAAQNRRIKVLLAMSITAVAFLFNEGTSLALC